MINIGGFAVYTAKPFIQAFAMKKLSILLIYFLFSVIPVFSQAIQIDWQNCFGGDLQDQAEDVVFTGDGFLIVGSYELHCEDCGSSGTQKDVWIIKTDLEGNQLWEKLIGGSKSETPQRILKATDGNYWILAGSASSDGDIHHDPYPENLNFWIVNIDSFGNILHEGIYGGNCRDALWNGTLTSDNAIIAFGFTCSEDGEVSNYFGAYDMWLLKLNSEGEKVWDFSFGTVGIDIGYSMISTSDQGFLAGGESYTGTGGNLLCEPFDDGTEAILFKLDSMGNLQWQQCYGGSGTNSVLSMIESSDGYLLGCVGSSNDGDLTGSGYHYGINHLGDRTDDVWLIKVDFEGNIIWQKCYGGSGMEGVKRIFTTEDGGYMVFGQTQSFDGDVTGNHDLGLLEDDIWVFKIDGNGTLEWQQCIGGGAQERIESGVYKLNESEYIVSGHFRYGPSGDITCVNQQNQDIWVFKITDTTVGLMEKDESSALIKVYPNPANTYVEFEHPVLSQGTIQIQNPYGQLVEELPAKDEKTVWDTRHILAGTYIFTLKSSGYSKTGKIVISK
jgi:hypothetical protein